MTQIKLIISGARATADVTGVLTSGMVGVQVNVEYDAVWEGLTKTLVCKSGAGTKAVVDIDDSTVIPAGVLKYSPNAQNTLFVGVEGRNAEGELVLPSEMAFCGVILPGAEPTEDASLSDDEPAWATIMSMIGDLEMLETEQRRNVVAAINELWEKGGTPGPKGEKGDTGATGARGADGTSVTVVSVSESDADGGSNVITFSDGKTITIKNGSKGSVGATGATGNQGAKGDKGDTGAQGAKGEKGDTGATGAKGKDGTSVTITSITESDEDGGENIITFSTGETLTVKNGKTGAGGTSDDYTLLGTTPLTLSNNAKVKMQCGQTCSYTVQTPTVINFDLLNSTLTNAVLTEEDGHYHIKINGTVSGWYQSHADITVTGLTVGETYNFVFDAAGLTYDDTATPPLTQGHWILYDGSSNVLLTRSATDNNKKQVRSFTATTTSVKLCWYPAATNTLVTAGAVGNVNRIYINRAGTSEHTQIIDSSGSFSGSASLGTIPTGATILSTPTCSVYSKTISTDENKTRHGGKLCVCFGDSVTGNMEAPYDYPSVLAEETGMEVVNGGFGGCRMSDTHTDAAYAAFSMVKLAEAVASGDWTTQDNNVNGLSVVCHGTEHLEALKSVDWSDVDFVTIAYGTNDVQSQVPLDDSGNALNTATYLGALRYSLTRILTAYPHIKVLLLTPIYRYWNDEGVDSDSKTFGGRTFTDWGDGLLEVAESYKIPAVDMYRTLGFNTITRTYYFPSTDGTHPNAKGLSVMGSKIAGRLLTEY